MPGIIVLLQYKSPESAAFIIEASLIMDKCEYKKRFPQFSWQKIIYLHRKLTYSQILVKNNQHVSLLEIYFSEIHATSFSYTIARLSGLNKLNPTRNKKSLLLHFLLPYSHFLLFETWFIFFDTYLAFLHATRLNMLFWK